MQVDFCNFSFNFFCFSPISPNQSNGFSREGRDVRLISEIFKNRVDQQQHRDKSRTYLMTVKVFTNRLKIYVLFTEFDFLQQSIMTVLRQSHYQFKLAAFLADFKVQRSQTVISRDLNFETIGFVRPLQKNFLRTSKMLRQKKSLFRVLKSIETVKTGSVWSCIKS